MVNLYDNLKNDFEEVTPLEFYRDIFKHHLDTEDSFTKGKYTGIACEFCGTKKDNGKELVKRYTITDDLEIIEKLLESENFIIISPISYAGKSRKSENARELFAFAIEIDGFRKYDDGRQIGYEELIYEFQQKILPTPNYIVASGNGLHLYYILEKPLLLFKNVAESLKNFKKTITPYFWNQYVTEYSDNEKIQFESVFQGFRMVGGVTKDGDRTKVFKVSDTPITVEQLNEFVPYDDNNIDVAYKSDLTLAEAIEKFPEWYEKRIVKKQPKGRWTCKQDLYNWWYNRIETERKVGHRYYCMMCLVIYAIKCDVPYEKVVEDCYSLLENFDSESIEETNRFTEKDIADALQAYEDGNLVTYPINSIINRSGLHIEKNKRNYRKQEQHMEVMRAIQNITNPNWRDGNGRPKGSKDKEPRKNKSEIVKEWRKNNPDGRKADCIRDTGLTKPTVYKWW